ncbi:M28 family peptidase [Psychrobium sp. 1_MG-2023]|uniref:M28 family peptidase n=1 Tax=Psychrobium sp. 1_MG-2023 TaxID=3062624 RepID=UPI000C32E8B1|nr:M28 family peptidase [Psychrobium sp. 1_MG-2023]MDP2561311.1 M28 family peptidase [Psychrobium sp. 1_MG-2023]PKF54126.1 peptidase M28 family protein [Alteromonadales bacterium alter-6D02]
MLTRFIQKSFILPTVIASSLAFPAMAALNQQSITNAEQLRETTLRAHLGYDIVESLTVEVGPRLAGTPADARAVAWAEAKFAELGFDKIYKQPVEVRHWERGHAHASVLSPYPQPLAITALGDSVATPQGGLKGELVFFDSVPELKKADPALVKGKIVYIDAKMHRHREGKEYSLAVAGRSIGSSVAAEKGAIGLIIRSVGTDQSRMPHTGNMNYKKGVEKIPAGAISTSDAMMLTAMKKRNKPIVVNMELGTQTYAPKVSYNVIGEITGSQYPDEYILIGAHLDSWDEGTGALDDGAGVGIVMAAAHAIKPLKPKRTIRVVLYANEEGGLVGAKEYRDANANELHKIKLAGESDFGARSIWRFDTQVHPDNLDLMAKITKVLKPLSINSGDNKARGGPDVSVLPAKGVPVFSLRQDGTDYFDYHHTANDTLDKINPEELRQNVAAWAVVAYLTAQSEEKLLPLPAKK